MALASTYNQKRPLRQLVLKTDIILVQMQWLIFLDFFTWKSFSGDQRL